MINISKAKSYHPVLIFVFGPIINFSCLVELRLEIIMAYNRQFICEYALLKNFIIYYPSCCPMYLLSSSYFICRLLQAFYLEHKTDIILTYLAATYSSDYRL